MAVYKDLGAASYIRAVAAMMPANLDRDGRGGHVRRDSGDAFGAQYSCCPQFLTAKHCTLSPFYRIHTLVLDAPLPLLFSHHPCTRSHHAGEVTGRPTAREGGQES